MFLSKQSRTEEVPYEKPGIKIMIFKHPEICGEKTREKVKRCIDGVRHTIKAEGQRVPGFLKSLWCGRLYACVCLCVRPLGYKKLFT